ncbi:MAG: hypothetical protein KKD69_06565 [Euryarchaeota archaeon]|nr:hypothetical protein [Euryarchaeota archaeon]MBU4492109.1 hypothetical protein [Euryarchaeota archaeon]
MIKGFFRNGAGFIENLFHQLARKLTVEKELNWDALYGLGKGLWKGEDAQEYVNQLREERG